MPLSLERSKAAICGKVTVYRAASVALSAVVATVIHISHCRPQHDNLVLLRCHPSVSRTPPTKPQHPALCTGKQQSFLWFVPGNDSGALSYLACRTTSFEKACSSMGVGKMLLSESGTPTLQLVPTPNLPRSPWPQE